MKETPTRQRVFERKGATELANLSVFFLVLLVSVFPFSFFSRSVFGSVRLNRGTAPFIKFLENAQHGSALVQEIRGI